MSDMKEIIKEQHEFSSSHFGTWEAKNKEQSLEKLKFGTIALTGEAGEFANVLKKILREPQKFDEKLPELKQELADVFTYTLLLSITLKMDLEEEWRNKLKKNEEKFKNFKA